ncbi:MAG TPA: DUF1566 domain-containing protein [Syntrophobacter fumaroxidans]|nr:DUF1566 domain-containing protein [Syntrophobacter fumaroxidans]
MADRFELMEKMAVLDRETGLMWQREASAERMPWGDGAAYIARLNATGYAGFSDWRFPTRDELADLILPEEDRQSGLYIDPLFGTQRNCWTSTQSEHHKACYVDFYYGDVYLIEENYANHFVRAVRTQRAD